jgi:hypothetical protein
VRNGARASGGKNGSEARMETEGLACRVLANDGDAGSGGEPVLTNGGALAGDSGVGFSGRSREGFNDGEGLCGGLRDGFSGGTANELDIKSGHGDEDRTELQAGRSTGFEKGFRNLVKDEVRVKDEPGSNSGNVLLVPHKRPLDEAIEAEETPNRTRVFEYLDMPSGNVQEGQKPWEVTPFRYVTQWLLPPSLETHGAAYQVGCSPCLTTITRGLGSWTGG